VAGQVIVAKGKLLTLTNREAAQAYGTPARPLLSAGTVGSLAEMLANVGLAGGTVTRVAPFGFERLARWITTISPLLILIGFLAIWVELTHPGLLLPALVAVICFGLYFLGYFAAGLAGWEVVALFVVGVALLGVEFVLFPGHFLSAALGTVAVVAALVLAMTGWWPGGSQWPDWPQLELPLMKVFGGLIGAVGGAAILSRYLPRSPLFHRMELRAATNTAEGYSSASGAAVTMIGRTGVAETNLRPAGSGRFADRLVDVVTEGDLIERGAPIKIVAVEGARVVVARNG
jgi:membrane-bound serine protease (ClpP class)